MKMPSVRRFLLLSSGFGALLTGFGSARGQEAYALDDLIRIGRERNPTIRSLRAEQAALEADRRASARWPNPELEFETGTGEPFEDEGSRSLRGLFLRQPLENPFSRHHRLNSMTSLALAAGQDIRSGILEMEYQVRMHVYRILFLRERVEEARLNEEALEAIRDLMETRARVGEVRELEAIRLRVEHLRARNETEAVKMELDQFRQHLNTYLGNALPPDFRLAGELVTGPEPPTLDALVEEALPHHPTLLQAVREREAAEAARKATGSGWIPGPVLTASSGREMDGNVKTFGIGIRIPLWNFSRSAVERDRQRVRVMEERERALRLELEAQIMIHLNNLRRARQTVTLFQDGLLGEAEASMAIAETSYRAGEISFLEYLDARRTYRSIQTEYQQALYDLNLERAALERAAGGGVQ